ncbi:MAG TPA: hypothetical protein VK721_06390 [Solirubrobacteraceae bacterium]|jgi:hypothetical protein|nr:hypothetical protein [Solirubrobacteraceae bacterium]
MSGQPQGQLAYAAVVRPRSATIVLVTCLLFGQSAIAAYPGVASAEWTEVSWPCDVAMGAVFPQPVLWNELGSPVVAPVGYFAYGEPASGAPSASDFTATVDWGDGTTAPAQVEAGGVENCYVVSAPSHAYAATGTYPFSYTIHDLKTGLDHKLAVAGYPEFHIWSKVPQLISGPSPRAIEAVVGTPWSGVVAEFSYTEASNSFVPYHAQIEWGDGEASPTATVIMRSGEHTFTVSGSHTYGRPLTGTTKVLLSYESEPLGAWATGSVDATPPIDLTHPAGSVHVTPPVRFHGQPLLDEISRSGKAPLYELVFRLNRALPQTGAGNVEAMIEANGQPSPIRQLTTRKVATCYAATQGGIGKRELKPGAHYPFTLVDEGASDTRYRAYGLVRRFASINRMHGAVSRQLGCA